MAARVRRTDALGLLGSQALGKLVEALRDKAAPVRYTAARWLGNLGGEARPASQALARAMGDPDGAVRVAAARAICLMGAPEEGLRVLRRELTNPRNEVVRHYAARALEDIGKAALPILDDLKAARADRYEYVRRVAARAVAILEGTYDPEKRPLTGRGKKRTN